MTFSRILFQVPCSRPGSEVVKVILEGFSI